MSLDITRFNDEQNILNFTIAENLGDHYVRSGNDVYWASVKLPGCDAAAFTYDKQHPDFARDAAQIYYQGIPLPLADLASFEILSEDYKSQKLPVNNASKFSALEPSYAKDDRLVFFGDQVLTGLRPDQLKILSGLFAKDETLVFFRNTLLPDANGASFRIAGASAPLFTMEVAKSLWPIPPLSARWTWISRAEACPRNMERMAFLSSMRRIWCEGPMRPAFESCLLRTRC